MDAATATVIGAVIIALFAALPGVLTGYASIKSANNAAAVAQKAVKVSEETLIQTKEIHVAVNSNLAALKQELADSNKLNSELRNMVQSLTEKLTDVDKLSVSDRLARLEKKKT